MKDDVNNIDNNSIKDNSVKDNPVKDNAGDFFIYNNSVLSIKKLGELACNTNNVVYEIVRIIDGIPLFLEDHFERMSSSFIMLSGQKPAIDEESLCNQIKTIVKKNNLKDCNVKITVSYQNSTQNLVIYISSSYYPNKAEVTAGVRTGLFKWERPSPNMKIVNSNYKEEAHKKMLELDAFEVLLVNKEGKITEGSRSNAFFVKAGKVFTSPDAFILKGVTRKYVLEACKRCKIEVIEDLVDVGSLSDIEGLFLSGTSIKVLPVKAVEDHCYNSGSHPMIIQIRDRYDEIIEEYLTSRRLS